MIDTFDYTKNFLKTPQTGEIAASSTKTAGKTG
jgi:hypothetical protein